jgi:hypothetical protein
MAGTGVCRRPSKKHKLGGGMNWTGGRGGGMRQWLAVLAAAGLLAGCAAGGGDRTVEGATATTTAPPPTRTDTVLVAPGGGNALVGGSQKAPETFQVTDVDARTSRAVSSPVPPAMTRSFPYLVRRGGIVQVVDPQRGAYDPQIGTAWAITVDWAHAVRLGAASFAFPSTEPGRVWLATDDATPNDRLQRYVLYGRHRTLTEVDLTGAATSPTSQLTGQRFPLAAVTGGILTSVRDGALPTAKDTHPPATYHLEVWDPASGQTVRRFPDDLTNPAATTTGAFLSYGATCTPGCPARLVDVATGAEHDLAPPAGLTWGGSGSFSPDGRLVALLTRPAPDLRGGSAPGYVPPGDETDTAMVYDTSTSQVVSTRPVNTWHGAVTLTWSADSAWLFITRDKTHVTYYPARYEAPPEATIDVPDGAAFLAVARPT